MPVAKADMPDWMSNLNVALKLSDVTMPGSHDAGIYDHTIASHTRTQAYPILAQLNKGSRFFDLRIYLDKKEPNAAPDDIKYRAGHFAEISGKGKADFGEFGGTLRDLLNDFLVFTIANPSEILILRFTHIHKKHAAHIAAQIRLALGAHLYQDAHDNLASRTIGHYQANGRILAVCDQKAFAGEFHGGILPWGKYSGPAQGCGLIACGDYANDPEISTVKANQLQHLNDHIANHTDHPDRHLLCLYLTQTLTKAQATGQSLRRKANKYDDHFSVRNITESGPPGIPGDKKSAHRTIQKITAKKGNKPGSFAHQLDTALRRPNVILHDFVNETTCVDIANLNPGL